MKINLVFSSLSVPPAGLLVRRKAGRNPNEEHALSAEEEEHALSKVETEHALSEAEHALSEVGEEGRAVPGILEVLIEAHKFSKIA